jgi:hypothetical protein
MDCFYFMFSRSSRMVLLPLSSATVSSYLKAGPEGQNDVIRGVINASAPAALSSLHPNSLGQYGQTASSLGLSAHPMVIDGRNLGILGLPPNSGILQQQHPGLSSYLHGRILVTANGELISLDPGQISLLAGQPLPADLASLGDLHRLGGGGGGQPQGIVGLPSHHVGLAGLPGISHVGGTNFDSAIGASLDSRGLNQEQGQLLLGPPQRMDVVVGQEAAIYSQDGNIHLQDLVQANVGQSIIPTEIKRIKAGAILERMHLMGCRFLMKERDGHGLWYRLTNKEAEDLIYRGLCEEEKRIQLILLSQGHSPALQSTATIGLGGITGHSSSHPLRSFETEQRSIESINAMQMESSDHRNSVDNGGIPDDSAPPKKKYKKRLRKVIEERRQMMNSVPQEEPEAKIAQLAEANSIKKKSVERISSLVKASTGFIDDESKITFLKGPVEIRQYDVILGRGRGSFNHPVRLTIATLQSIMLHRDDPLIYC